MSNLCEREFSDSNFIKKLLAKYRFFKKLPQISHINKNRNFSSIIKIFYPNCFYHINFKAVAWEEFRQLWAVKHCEKCSEWNLYYILKWKNLCVGVCVGGSWGCPAMRSMLRGMGLKLSMKVGDRPPRLKSIFQKWPDQRLKVIQRSSCFRNGFWPLNLVGRTPGENVMHCWI